MITRIQDHYVDFAPKVQHKIEEKFGSFLETCTSFFEEQEKIGKNLDIYIRSTDPLKPWKTEFNYIVELDNHTWLDLVGIYDVEKNELRDPELRGTLPYHETWDSEHFSGVSFDEQERAMLIQKQEAFLSAMNELGVRIVFDMVAFNPDRDTLPEALVAFQPTTSFESFISSENILKWMKAYYAHYIAMDECFNQKINDKGGK